MPFNMLLLPLLGGYIFVRFWNYTRYHVMRSDRERLIIRASLAALFSLLIAYIGSFFGAWIFPCSSWSICIESWWREKVPFEYSGVSIAAFLIGAVSWIPLNFYFTQKKEIDRAIKEDADPLEMLLKRAQDENIEVLVTMTNNKVYIGFVTHPFNPANPTKNIGLLPVQSGYRDPTTKFLSLPVSYSQAYERILKEIDDLACELGKLEEIRKKVTDIELESINDKIQRLIEEWDELETTSNLFETVIPVSQIASVNFYNKEVHRKYFTISSLVNPE